MLGSHDTPRTGGSTPADAPPGVTLILPTYNERLSLPPLLHQLSERLQGQPWSWEILVVDDDSPDGTAQAARDSGIPGPLRVIVRSGERGLASAILRGLWEARGRVALVLDADGSHPPELVVPLVDEVLSGRCEMALASRYIRGGSTRGGPLRRRFLSRGATLLARPLTPVKDPMSGFFAVDREILSRARLDPVGYKIALEILARCRPAPVREIPFEFRDRREGESKMGAGEVLRYLRHLGRLYRFRLAGRLPLGQRGGPGVSPGGLLPPQR